MHVVLLIDFLKKIEKCDIFYTRIKKKKTHEDLQIK